MANGLDIHEFAGTANDFSSDILNKHSVSEISGYKPTRAAGILAMILNYYPDFNFEQVAAWAAANGLSDWEITTDPGDTALVATDGSVLFIDGAEITRAKFPDWGQSFLDWSAGNLIVPLPEQAIQAPDGSGTIPVNPPSPPPGSSTPTPSSPSSMTAATTTTQTTDVSAPGMEIPFWVWIIGGIVGIKIAMSLMEKKK